MQVFLLLMMMIMVMMIDGDGDDDGYGDDDDDNDNDTYCNNDDSYNNVFYMITIIFNHLSIHRNLSSLPQLKLMMVMI